MEHPSAHKGSYVRKGRKPAGRRRTREQIDKDAKALSLHLQGKLLREIADACGWKSQATALMAVRRAIADRQNNALGQAEEFAAAIARIQKAIAECQGIIDSPPPLATATGKLVINERTGEPVLDVGARQRAITEQRHLNDQMIMLMDLKPAAKQRVTVVTEDVVDDEIRRLSKELAEAGKMGPEVPTE